MKSLVQLTIASPEPTLLDQLADQFDESIVEYELLEQKYKQLQLENDQYLSHNAFLQSENDELTQKLKVYQTKESNVGHVIDEHREEMKEVKYKLTEYYIEVIQRLQCENKELKQQMDATQAVLENQSKCQQIMKRIQDDTENNFVQIQNELNVIKAKYDVPSTNMVPPMHEYSTSAPSKLYLSKTNSSVQTTWAYNDIAADVNDSNPPSVYLSDYSLNSNNSHCTWEYDEYKEYEEMGINVLKLKMHRMETQNKELMQNINMKNINDDNDKMFTEEDLDEMEALFRKCDIEKNKNEQKQKDKWFWIRFKTNKY